MVTSKSKKKPVGALLFKNSILNLESSVILLPIKIYKNITINYIKFRNDIAYIGILIFKSE
ncbi:hypothetical protein oki169_19470 [Helicobacter pylori]